MKWLGSPDSGPLPSAVFPDTIGGVLDGPPAAGCPSSPTCPVLPAEFEGFQAQGLSSLGHLCISGVYEGDSGERVGMLRWFCTGTRGPESSIRDSWKWNRERHINTLVAQPIHLDSCRSPLIPDPRFPSSPEGSGMWPKWGRSRPPGLCATSLRGQDTSPQGPPGGLFADFTIHHVVHRWYDPSPSLVTHKAQNMWVLLRTRHLEHAGMCGNLLRILSL